jgi:hypothetical protein
VSGHYVLDAYRTIGKDNAEAFVAEFETGKIAIVAEMRQLFAEAGRLKSLYKVSFAFLP